MTPSEAYELEYPVIEAIETCEKLRELDSVQNWEYLKLSEVLMVLTYLLGIAMKSASMLGIYLKILNFLVELLRRISQE